MKKAKAPPVYNQFNTAANVIFKHGVDTKSTILGDTHHRLQHPSLPPLSAAHVCRSMAACLPSLLSRHPLHTYTIDD